MKACGWGWVTLETFVEPMWDFLKIKNTEFDCSDIPADVEYKSLSYRDQRAFYYREIVANLWSMFGVSQRSLWPMLAIAHGAYGMAAYILMRLYFTPWISVAGSMLMVLSSGAVTMLSLFRDYSKGPFFLAELILLILIVRTDRRANLIGLATLAGAVVGIGSGFRADVLILVPFFILSILGFLRFRSIEDAAVRGTALGGFLLTMIAALSPSFGEEGNEYRTALKGNQGWHGSQGLTRPFTTNLGLDSSFYDTGHRYSDELTMGMIVGFYTRTPNGPVIGSDPRGISENTISAPVKPHDADEYYLNEVMRFPADIVVRAFASMVRILNYFTMLDHDTRATQPGGIGFPARFPSDHLVAGWHEATVVEFLNKTKLSKFGVLFIFGLLYYVLRKNPREALFLTVLIGWTAAYPAFQFSYRHAFHLEFLYWMGAFATVWLIIDVFRNRQLKGNWRLFLKTAAAFVVVFVAVLASARWIQHENLELTVLRHLDSRKEALPLESDPRKAESFIAVDVPERQLNVLARPPDDQTYDARVVRPLELVAVVETGLETYVASFGGIGCDAPSVKIKLSYARSPDTWQPFDRIIDLRMPTSQNERARLVFPAFYRASQHFEGLELSAETVPCLTSLERIDDENFNEQPIFLFLEEGWQEARHYQTFLN